MKYNLMSWLSHRTLFVKESMPLYLFFCGQPLRVLRKPYSILDTRDLIIVLFLLKCQLTHEEDVRFHLCGLLSTLTSQLWKTNANGRAHENAGLCLPLLWNSDWRRPFFQEAASDRRFHLHTYPLGVFLKFQWDIHPVHPDGIPNLNHP